MDEMHDIELVVNGQAVSRKVPARLILADFLRQDLELTGTHVGCEHGVCGACTVLLDGDSVRACLMFAVQANGHELTTIEGLTTSLSASPALEGGVEPGHSFSAAGALKGGAEAPAERPGCFTPAQGLSPLQQSFCDHHAMQCGFCTPGMIVTAEAFLAREEHIDAASVRTAMSGNICRCTGYQPIVDAVMEEGRRRGLVRNEDK